MRLESLLRSHENRRLHVITRSHGNANKTMFPCDLVCTWPIIENLRKLSFATNFSFSLKMYTTQWNGTILTGNKWRKEHSSLHTLPFHSNIPRMDNLAKSFRNSFSSDHEAFSFSALLVVNFSLGLPNYFLSQSLTEHCRGPGQYSSVFRYCRGRSHHTACRANIFKGLQSNRSEDCIKNLGFHLKVRNARSIR